jgi:ankyrin repeat protein
MRRRTTLITLLLLAVVVAVPIILTWRMVRLERLNHVLIAAVNHNHPAAARRLLKQGADPNAKVAPEDRRTLWKRMWDMIQNRHVSTPIRYPSVLEAAIEGWPDDNTDPDHADMVRALADAGADINSRFTHVIHHPMLTEPESHGTTPLVEAARWNKWKTVQVLLDHHADVNATDNYAGETCLMYAAVSGELGIVQALLSHGARVNTQDKRGETALFWVLHDGSTIGDAVDLLMMRDASSPSLHVQAIVACLLRHGAQINARDKNGETPLIAATSGRFATADLVHLLLEHGADVNVQDRFGATALYHAVEFDPNSMKEKVDKAIILQLLSYGANPNRAGKNEQTPLMLAKQEKRPDLVALLQKYGAKEK